MAACEEDVAGEYSKNKDGLKQEDVEMLGKWTKTRPYLPDLSERRLILFLQSCNYDVDAAKTAIESFFQLKVSNMQIFGSRDPNSYGLRLANSVFLIAFLPELTPEGYRVCFVKFLDTDASKFSYDDLLKLMDMKLMLMLRQHGTSKGLVIVVDHKGVSFMHLIKMSLRGTKVALNYVQDALPVRCKGLHFFNCSALADKFMALLGPFVKGELVGNLMFHSKMEDVFKFVPRHCFPEEYGGRAGPIVKHYERQTEDLSRNSAFFLEEEMELLQVARKLKDVGGGGNRDGLISRTLRFIRLK